MRFHLDDVVAVGGFHQVAELADRGCERSLLKLGNHLPFRDPAQFAALRAGAGVLRIGFGQSREIAAGFELFQKRLSFRLHLGVRVGAIHFEQNVPGLHALGQLEIHKKWDWNAYFGYRYLESDSTLSALTDTDFHQGGTNAQGYAVGGSLGIGHNTWVAVRLLSAQAISGPHYGTDSVYLDLNSSF